MPLRSVSGLFSSDAQNAIPLYAVSEAEVKTLKEVLDPVALAWAETQGFKGQAGKVLQLPDAQGGLGAVVLG
ncbi:MAG TPA: hypothetical protein DCL54_01095, partial [Alphaproteobacteria bacterium]|nr:hypothetical protein [Alphaproteobacteria bacterium]